MLSAYCCYIGTLNLLLSQLVCHAPDIFHIEYDLLHFVWPLQRALKKTFSLFCMTIILSSHLKLCFFDPTVI